MNLVQTPSIVNHGIQMAKLPCTIYSKLQELYSKYEAGETKGQVPNTREHRKRNIAGKYQIKLTHFKLFQGLNVSPIQ